MVRWLDGSVLDGSIHFQTNVLRAMNSVEVSQGNTSKINVLPKKIGYFPLVNAATRKSRQFDNLL